MADDVSLDITFAEPGGTYGLNTPVTGSVRLRCPRARFCRKLEAHLVFIRQPADLRGWSDDAVLAEEFRFGGAGTADSDQAPEFPFLFTTPPQPIQGSGEWYVEVNAHVGSSDSVRARRLVTLPMQLEGNEKRPPARPFTGAGATAEADPAEGPWTTSDLIAGFVYAAFFLTGALFGAALALDLWNRGIPMAVQTFGLILLLGGAFVTMKFVGAVPPLRWLAGGVLVAASALGLYLAFGEPGWAPLRPARSVPGAGFSVLGLASDYADPRLSFLAGKARAALLGAYVLAVLAGWILGQVGRRGPLTASEVPLGLLLGPPPALLGWLVVSRLAGGLGAEPIWLWTLGLMAVLVYVGRDQLAYLSRYPLASLLTAGVILVSCWFEWRNPSASGVASAVLVAGWGALAVGLAFLGNRRALAERGLGAVDVQILPSNQGTLGRPMRAVFAFTPRQPVRVARIRMLVICAEQTVDNPNRKPGDRTHSTNIVWQQEAHQRFAEVLPAGQPVRQELSLLLPASVPSSAHRTGEPSWELRLAIEVEDAPDWSLTLPLTVVKP